MLERDYSWRETPTEFFNNYPGGWEDFVRYGSQEFYTAVRTNYEISSLWESEFGGYWSSSTGRSLYENEDQAFFATCDYIESYGYWGNTDPESYGNAESAYTLFQSKGYYTASLDEGPTETYSLFADAPKKDFSGLWGGLKYFLNGGNIGGYHYNMKGEVTGLAPITGIAPTPGKVGNVFIKGFGMLEKELFHLAIKPEILKSAGNFSKIVGRNPDIIVKEGLIILKGTGSYSGKIYQTGLNALNFFGF